MPGPPPGQPRQQYLYTGVLTALCRQGGAGRVLLLGPCYHLLTRSAPHKLD